MRHRGGTALLAALLFLFSVALFRPALDFEFLEYDDNAYVTDNRQVRGGLTEEGAAWAFTTSHVANWHPLTWLSHMLDVELFGVSPRGHHLTNVLFHGANAALLFLLLGAMTGSRWRSLFVAALFAAHPLHVESVAWVSERKDLLSTLLWLAATGAYLRYARRISLRSYLPLPLLFTLALMSKPMVVTLPFLLLLLDFWPLGRMRRSRSAPGGAPPRGRSPSWGLLLSEKIPLLVLSGLSSAVTYRVQQGGDAVRDLALYSTASRFGNAFLSYGSYLTKTFFPSRLSIFYPHPMGGRPHWQVLLGAALLVAASLLAVRGRRSSPFLLLGWFWFLGTLVPVIGLVQVGAQAMADRYTYVPVIGIFIAVAWGIGEAASGSRVAKGVLPLLAAAVLLPLTVGTHLQLRHWRDTGTLFSHAVEVTEHNWMAHNVLGGLLAAEGRAEEAAVHYRRALEIRPDYAEANVNYGLQLYGLGELREAKRHFERALSVKADLVEAVNGMGVVLAAEGRGEEAAAYYREALRLRPDYPEAHVNLGVLAAGKGETGAAAGHFERALAQDPFSTEALFNLATILSGEGREREAVPYYRRLLEITPGDTAARAGLERALSRIGE